MTVPVVSIFEAGDYEQQIARAADLLRGGGVVVLPTETVYGAAGVLGNDKALARLKSIRGNSDAAKPFTIHLAHREQAARYLGQIGEVGTRLMKKLWPGPVALVFDVPPPRRADVANSLKTAESDVYYNATITLRCPDHILATALIARIDETVVLTAAAPAA